MAKRKSKSTAIAIRKSAGSKPIWCVTCGAYATGDINEMYLDVKRKHVAMLPNDAGTAIVPKRVLTIYRRPAYVIHCKCGKRAIKWAPMSAQERAANKRQHAEVLASESAKRKYFRANRPKRIKASTKPKNKSGKRKKSTKLIMGAVTSTALVPYSGPSAKCATKKKRATRKDAGTKKPVKESVIRSRIAKKAEAMYPGDPEGQAVQIEAMLAAKGLAMN